MKIIFVCTGNTCRSPMAEYLFREECQRRKLNIEVESRGLACADGKSISENSKAVLKELGINCSEHRSKGFVLKDMFDADLVVTMTKGHKDMLIYHFNGSNNIKTFDEVTGIGDVEDPYGCGVDIYRQCRDKIATGVKILISNLQNNL